MRGQARPGPSLRGKLARLVVSLALALAAAELGAHALHRGAFPFLNIFRADARYGVLLLPETSTRVRSRDGRVTTIATNALGFRGPAWPPPGERPGAPRVLLLGDSQMLGYGVDWPQTIAPALERALGGGAVVLDAAVPSWGPTEYVAALEELGPIHRPTTVVFVANAANDWFETTVPNTRRTTARDGWAARFDPGAPAPRWFPARSYLMSRSHLVLALRQLAGYLGGGELPPSASALQLARDLPRLRRGTPGPCPQGGVGCNHRSTMTPALLAAVARCRALGCRVVAVALPLDVQVSPAEWRKYREPPRDLQPTEALLDDFIADARDAGLTAVNLMPALRAAEPGAFLPDDYHLSPRGHAAAALAIAHALVAERASAEVTP